MTTAVSTHFFGKEIGGAPIFRIAFFIAFAVDLFVSGAAGLTATGGQGR